MIKEKNSLMTRAEEVVSFSFKIEQELLMS